MALPFTDPILIKLLNDWCSEDVGDRIGFELETVPAIRVASIGDFEAPSPVERTPLYQIEVWAASAYEAGSIATKVANIWPTLGRQEVLDAYVSKTWIESHPRAIATDDSTDFYRYIFVVGLRVHAKED